MIIKNKRDQRIIMANGYVGVSELASEFLEEGRDLSTISSCAEITAYFFLQTALLKEDIPTFMEDFEIEEIALMDASTDRPYFCVDYYGNADKDEVSEFFANSLVISEHVIDFRFCPAAIPFC